MTRHSYTFVLEITPRTALTHGAGNNGNEQELHRRTLNVCRDGRWGQEDVACVSGAAMKATLREHAGLLFLQLAGISEVNRDGLRLLFKGGKMEGSDRVANLDEARRMRDLLPVLSVFGAMDGAMIMRGRVQVSTVMPYTDLTVGSGLIDVGAAGLKPLLFGGQPPLPHHLIESPTPITYYRHDLKTSHAAALLPPAELRQIEDAAAARKGKAAGKDERREANESMPHAFQAIAPGTPMVCTIRLTDATDNEAACLMLALTRWISSGAHLGGASSKGHGQCAVRIAVASRTRGVGGPVPVTVASAEALEHAESIDPSAEAFATAYAEHVRANADQIRKELNL
jgi:hypothetical protein